MYVPTIQEYYLYVITFLIVMTSLIMIFISLGNVTFDRSQRLRFVSIFALSIILSWCDLATFHMEFNHMNDLIALDYALNYILFAFSPLVPLLLSRALFAGRQKVFVYFVYFLYTMVLIFLTAYQKIFILDPETLEYSRGYGYFFFYVPCLSISFIYLLFNTFRITFRVSNKKRYLLFILFAGLIIGLTLQIIKMTVHINILIITIVTTIFYDYISSLWAQTDGLTGLLSHYAFLNHVKTLKDGDAIFMLDADNFKQINDKYGHVQGDRSLVAMGQFILKVFSKYGRCYRLGGDEFAVIVPHNVDFNKLVKRYKIRIKEQLDDKFPNISIGYSVFNKGKPIEHFGDIADHNMYLDKAKNKGLNDQNIEQ